MSGSAFVSKESVPVSVPADPQNIIWIKPKMDLGTQAKVQSAFLKILGDGGGSNEAEIDPGAYNLALLVNNITDWQGPLFRGVKCSIATIPQLDPDLDLIDAVLAEIQRRNPPKVQAQEGESPNAPAPAGARPSTSDGATN